MNFAQLLRQDWFYRRWIIQEVAASRLATIRYGGVEMKWGDFVDAIEIIHGRFEEIQTTCLEKSLLPGLDLSQRVTIPAKPMVETTINVFRHWEGS